jgi:hypothetical protein
MPERIVLCLLRFVIQIDSFAGKQPGQHGSSGILCRFTIHISTILLAFVILQIYFCDLSLRCARLSFFCRFKMHGIHGI